eukprot:TRINITY_DN5897_c0_g2_i1.p1 TRINITY_DN5897_c0_g2~~TRINITY_DN5897_c0_g2_i1.p1  ORF type:complete len:281 (-),score=31.91 TRINITY_DN5897_c0_g2_i1:240-1082(-)
MHQPFGLNDGILILSLLYSCIDLLCEWNLFSTCICPIHSWLLVSYAGVIIFRVAHVLSSGEGAHDGIIPPDFFITMRRKGAMPMLLASFTWAIALPLFLLWTFTGSFWLWRVVHETPSCAPTNTYLWFSGFWMALCYVFVAVNLALAGVAFRAERRLRTAERHLREIEDSDVRSRWGNVSSILGQANYTDILDRGLTPAEIKQLPCCTLAPRGNRAAVFRDLDGDLRDCSICIQDLQPGDSVRRLPCSHTFHKSCVDLWLLRRAECPLCKRAVGSAAAAV